MRNRSVSTPPRPDDASRRCTRLWRRHCAVDEAGEHLLAAKELLPHGQWADWVQENFPHTDRTTSKYMRIASYWNKDWGESEGPIQQALGLNVGLTIDDADKAIATYERSVRNPDAVPDDEFERDEDLIKLATDYLRKSIPTKIIIKALSRKSIIFLYHERDGEAGKIWKELLQKHFTAFKDELNVKLDDAFNNRLNAKVATTGQADRPTVERRRITRLPAKVVKRMKSTRRNLTTVINLCTKPRCCPSRRSWPQQIETEDRGVNRNTRMILTGHGGPHQR